MCEPDFMEDALTTHNYWRRRHGVPSLRLNSYLCKLAQGWAVHLATTARPLTSENTFYQRPLGENIAMKWADNGTDVTGREITDKWYSGIARYDYHTQSGEDTGQFTQMIWRDSEDFGIGKAQIEDGSWVVVANYYPAGNIVGQYAYNVRGTVDGRVILPNQTYRVSEIGPERIADPRFLFPGQREPYAQTRPPKKTMRGSLSLERARNSTTSTIYPYSPDQTYQVSEIGPERTAESRFLFPGPRDPHAQPRPPKKTMRGPPTLERARTSTTSTIYPYSPDQRDPHAQIRSPLKGPPTLQRDRKSATSTSHSNSPADNPVTKMVKTQKSLDYHNGVPYTKTITTETNIHPDGSRNVVTTETLDPM